MFRFNRQQIDGFEASALTAFLRRVESEVRDSWPEECRRVGEDHIPAFVERAAHNALQAGFESEHDVARFIHLTVAFEDLQFHRAPWAVEVLQPVDLAPHSRMDLLRRLHVRKPRNAARKRHGRTLSSADAGA